MCPKEIIYSVHMIATGSEKPKFMCARVETIIHSYVLALTSTGIGGLEQVLFHMASCEALRCKHTVEAVELLEGLYVIDCICTLTIDVCFICTVAT